MKLKELHNLVGKKATVRNGNIVEGVGTIKGIVFEPSLRSVFSGVNQYDMYANVAFAPDDVYPRWIMVWENTETGELYTH